jgi:hypothetical protein|tara:strand:- start:6927 stop:7121 length:195 start_codon:yes stop_codon:yes gene_type:complete
MHGPGTYGKKVGRPSNKEKKGYMHGGKIHPGPSVDGIDVATNVKKPNKTMRGVGAATKGIKFFG